MLKYIIVFVGVKVLPERVPGQRLRLTRNGDILHSGGTLTGRKYDHQVHTPHLSMGPLQRFTVRQRS